MFAKGLAIGGLQLVGDMVRVGTGPGILLMFGPLKLRGIGNLLRTSDLRLLSGIVCFN